MTLEEDLLRPVNSGDCWDYARRAWALLTGRDLGPRPGYSERPARFERLTTPTSPSVALYTAASGRLHVGVYWRGRTWHLREGGRPQAARAHQLVEYGTVEYYQCA